MNLIEYKKRHPHSTTKTRIQHNLDDSPKYIYEIGAYRSCVEYLLRQGLKWSRIRRDKQKGITCWNLKTPHFSYGVSNSEVGDKVERWFVWMKK